MTAPTADENRSITVTVQSASGQQYTDTDRNDEEMKTNQQQPKQSAAVPSPAASSALTRNDLSIQASAVATTTASRVGLSIPSPDERPTWVNLLVLLALIGCGILQGVFYHRVGILDPRAVYGQMVWKTYVVLKMFISGLGCSLLATGLVAFFSPQFFRRTRAKSTVRVGWLRSIAGGVMVGAGMAIGGGGPTITPAGMGASSENAHITFLCQIGGAFVYCLAERLVKGRQLDTEVAELKKRVRRDHSAAGGEKLVQEGAAAPGLLDATSLDEWLGMEDRFWIIALVAGSCMVIFSWCFEFFVVTAADDQSKLTLGKILWPTSTIGFVIGFNQIVSRLAMFSGTGVSLRDRGGVAGSQTIVSAVSFGWLAPGSWPDSIPKIYNLFFYYFATALGGYISLVTAEPLGVVPSKGFHIWRHIVGGFVGMIGASTTSGGCTCGSSLSGGSELNIESLLATCMIFAGAIPTAFILQAAGAEGVA